MQDIFSYVRSRTLLLRLLLLLLLLLLLPYGIHGYHTAAVPPVYCVNLQCQVKESRREEFLTLVVHNQKKTLQDEPEALQYVIGEDITTRNMFYIHEQFHSLDGFADHRNTPHNADWQSFKATHPFVLPPITHYYHGTHPGIPIPIRKAFCLNVQLHIKMEYREEFLQVIENNAKNSILEPLCLQYSYGEDTSTPNTFHFS